MTKATRILVLQTRRRQSREAFKTPHSTGKHCRKTNRRETISGSARHRQAKPHATGAVPALTHAPPATPFLDRSQNKAPALKVDSKGRAAEGKTRGYRHATCISPHPTVCSRARRLAFTRRRRELCSPPRKGEARGRRRITSLRSDMGWAVHLH